MNIEHPESKKQRLIAMLAEKAMAFVNNSGSTEREAVSAVMNTYSGDVLDQRKALFGPVIKEVRRCIAVDQARIAAGQQRMRDKFMADAAANEEQLSAGFDGDYRPFGVEPSDEEE